MQEMGMILIILDHMHLYQVFKSISLMHIRRGYGGVGTQPMRQHQDEWESIDGSATAIR